VRLTLPCRAPWRKPTVVSLRSKAAATACRFCCARLNARVLAFNVDPAFGDALDALMTVDLTEVDRRLLDRYFGRSAARSFLERHSSACSAPDAA
jgi:hypothetical protein